MEVFFFFDTSRSKIVYGIKNFVVIIIACDKVVFFFIYRGCFVSFKDKFIGI